MNNTGVKLTYEEALKKAKSLGPNYTVELNSDGSYNVVLILSKEGEM